MWKFVVLVGLVFAALLVAWSAPPSPEPATARRAQLADFAAVVERDEPKTIKQALGALLAADPDHRLPRDFYLVADEWLTGRFQPVHAERLRAAALTEIRRLDDEDATAARRFAAEAAVRRKSLVALAAVAVLFGLYLALDRKRLADDARIKSARLDAEVAAKHKALDAMNQASLDKLRVEREARKLREEHVALLRRYCIDSKTTLLKYEEGMDRLRLALETSLGRTTHSVLFLDLDHFKKVNEICSHVGADDVLRQWCVALKTVTREDDFVFRFGGEEIGVFLNAADKIKALELAEHYRRMTEEMVIETVHSPHPVRITCSVGVAEVVECSDYDDTLQALKAHSVGDDFDPDAETPATRACRELADQWLKLAAERAKQAKTDGRNRVCGELPAHTQSAQGNGGLRP